MSGKVYHLLFLCTGNSARSIMAEALARKLGAARFRAFSAGSHPRTVHPLTLEVLKARGLGIEGLRSKSWNEFAALRAPRMDFVITVCDRAAGEVCPLWPGEPVTAHWSIPDPAAAEGAHDQRRGAFERAMRELEARIRLLVSLPLEQLDRVSVKRRIDEIGRGRPGD